MNIEEYTPLYTKLDIEYQQLYSGPYKPNIGLMATKNDAISAYGRPVVGDFLPDILDKFCKNLCHKLWYLDFLEGGKLSSTSRYLLRQGIVPRPYYTQIIDLTKSKKELHADLRKSYKSLVNKPQIISRLHNIDLLRQLHIQAHGRETRSKETWFVQQKMVWQNQVFALLQVKFLNMSDPLSGKSQTGGLFYYNSHICYYGVGCSVEGAGSHALIWQAILYAKELGCKKFDMGRQVFEGDEKAMNISMFKRGFGGQTKVYLEFKGG